MVHPAPGAVTRLGFRKNVKLFLSVLVGFLVVIIFSLLILLQRFGMDAEAAVRAQWRSASLAAADAVERSGGQPGAIEAIPVAIRGRHGAVAVEIISPDITVASGITTAGDLEMVERETAYGTVRLYFDASSISSTRRVIRHATTIAALSTVGGCLLLFVFLPRLLRPFETMLDQAETLAKREANEDEALYLTATFQRSIDRLKQQESELKRLHELERARADDFERIVTTLTRSLTSGFIALDREGRVTEVNRAAREILLLEHRQISGESVAATLGESPLTDRLRQAFIERQSLTRQELTTAVDSRALVIGLTTVPLFNETDEFLGMLVLFTDLTPIRDLEGRLRELQALADLGEISAGIAHEFRNSLSTILGYLKLAARSNSLEESGTRVEHAATEARELLATVEGLLSFARPMHLTREPLELRSLTAAVVDRLRSQYPGVTFHQTGEEATIDGDSALLARALENVIRNAAEAAEEGTGAPMVEIDCRALPEARLTVADNGKGLVAESASRLFLPFQSTKSNGVGLGLPLARKIVLLHGGSITLSNRPDRGACASIHFAPRKAETSQNGTPALSAKAGFDTRNAKTVT